MRRLSELEYRALIPPSKTISAELSAALHARGLIYSYTGPDGIWRFDRTALGTLAVRVYETSIDLTWELAL